MLNAHRVFVSLPAPWQFELARVLGKAGLLERVPLMRMFIRTLLFLGARTDEVSSALRQAAPGQPNASHAWLCIAEQAAAEAHHHLAVERHELACAAFSRATLYAGVANWGVRAATTRAQNHAHMRRNFDAYAALATPAIECLWIDTPTAKLAALYREPARVRGAVLLFPGTDETKEWMAPFEAAAHAQGLATLSIDLPGMGESGIAGSRLRSFSMLGDTCRAAVDALQQRIPAGTPIGAFGISAGGMVATTASGWDPRIRASVGVGSPLNIERICKWLSAAQQLHALTWTGVDKVEELPKVMRSSDILAHLARVRTPCLLVHGTDDDVVPTRDAFDMAKQIGASAEVQLLAADDHTCTYALEAGAANTWFEWLSQRLQEAQSAYS